MPARPRAVMGRAVMGRAVRGPATAAAIYRVDWVPGTDRLVGTCHCGATGEAEDPVRIWQWLLAHPDHPAHAEPGPRTP